MSSVLIVDDERSIRTTLGAFLVAKGHKVETAEDYDEAVKILTGSGADLIVTDIILGERDGMDLLRTAREMGFECPIVVITGEPSVETAIQSIKYGAFDYLKKPVLKEPFLKTAERALKYEDLRKVDQENRERRREYENFLEARIQDQSKDLSTALENLKISEERYKSLIEAVPEAIAELDESGHITWLNRIGEEWFGRSAVGMNLLDSASGSSERKKISEALAFLRARTGDIVHVEAHHECKAGSKRLFSWTFKKFAPVGSSGSVFCTGRDITDLRCIEERLRQTSKLESIGKLAGGVAHDFNNMLGAILAQANVLKATWGSYDEIKQSAEFIENAVHKAEALTKQLLGFARSGKKENVTVDIHRVIRDACSLLKRTVGKNITVAEELAAEKCCVRGDPDQLHQVMINLGINARDAINTGGGSGDAQGTILFSTSVVQGSELPLSAPKAKGPLLKISVSDSGCGIPEEIREKIFEPFFTTKPVGEGTGMGLSLVYGIVADHSGILDLTSTDNRGTTFNLYFPLSKEQHEAIPADAKQGIIPGKGKILVIDDERLVLDSLKKLLTYLGYNTVTASSCREGLSYYKDHFEQIDLIFMDMIMPGKTGLDHFRELKKINPNAKIVLTSGYGLNESAQAIIDQGAAALLKKPYRLDEVSQLTAGVLSGF